MNAERKKNIILVMSGGSGQRFGADTPKQYCDMGGRPVIEYALDACKFSSADDIVIVTAREYLDIVYQKYGFPTTVGGSNRTISLYNGLQYVKQHYNCDKLIVVNAVCPLMSEEQIDRYFELLDDYDYVLTAWRIVSSLHKFDGTNIDRNDYFQCMEPEAYRFDMLYANYKANFPAPYIFHQMPKNARGFYCFDYPYTMKITYAFDIKIAYFFYKELIANPRRERNRIKMNQRLLSFGQQQVTEWLLSVGHIMEELVNRWELVDYSINPWAQTSCVFEAKSQKYGDVIVKIHSPKGNYDTELEYYRKNKLPEMAPMLDYDEEYRALLLKKVIPGNQVKFECTDPDLRKLYDNINQSWISLNDLEIERKEIPTVLDYMETIIRIAKNNNYRKAYRSRLVDISYIFWKQLFENENQYFLHRDLHKRNILRGAYGVNVIDPLGIIGPKEFEFAISFVIELRNLSGLSVRERYLEMLDYFSVYCPRHRLEAAVFFTWVYKIEEYIFSKNDNYKMLDAAIESLNNVFFNGIELPAEKVDKFVDSLIEA